MYNLNNNLLILLYFVFPFSTSCKQFLFTNNRMYNSIAAQYSTLKLHSSFLISLSKYGNKKWLLIKLI